MIWEMENIINNHVEKMLIIYNKYSSIDVKDVILNGVRSYESEAKICEESFEDECLAFNVGNYEISWELTRNYYKGVPQVIKYIENPENDDEYILIKIFNEGIHVCINFSTEITIPFEKALNKDNQFIVNVGEKFSNEIAKDFWLSHMEFLDEESRIEAMKFISEVS